VGDAAGFVDPILAVGCFLGQWFGRVLAYTLNTSLDAESGLTEEQAFAGYAHQVLDTVAAYREVTYFFYRFNERKDAWWEQARGALATTAEWASDEGALLGFATGFAAKRSTFREPTAPFDEGFFRGAYRDLLAQEAEEGPSSPATLSGEDVITLLGEVVLTQSAVPVDGTGRLGPSLRVEVRVNSRGRHSQRLQVPPSMGSLFALIDGKRTVTQLGDAMASELGVAPNHLKAVRRYTTSILADLTERGLAKVA